MSPRPALILAAAFATGAIGAASAETGLPADEARSDAPAIILFDKAGLKGDQLKIEGPVPRFPGLEFNDKARSIRVLSGRWLICEHAEYNGRCAIIDASVGDLCDYWLDDKISSVHPLYLGGSLAEAETAPASESERHLYEEDRGQYSPRTWRQTGQQMIKS